MAVQVIATPLAKSAQCLEGSSKHGLLCPQDRENARKAAGEQWPAQHAREMPQFYETLEATIKHVWIDKSSYETYAQSVANV